MNFFCWCFFYAEFKILLNVEEGSGYLAIGKTQARKLISGDNGFGVQNWKSRVSQQEKVRYVD